MNQYTETLNHYLSENPLKLTNCKMTRLLDILYCCYTQRKGVNTEKIRLSFRQLDSILALLPLEQQSDVVDVTCDLCDAHQQEGFRDGILIGFHLFEELSQTEKQAGSQN